MKSNPNPTQDELEQEFSWVPREVPRCCVVHPDGQEQGGWCKRETDHAGVHANRSGTWQRDLEQELIENLEWQFQQARIQRLMANGFTKQEVIDYLEQEAPPPKT